MVAVDKETPTIISVFPLASNRKIKHQRGGMTSWQSVKHARLYSDPLQAFKGRTIDSSGCSTEGILQAEPQNDEKWRAWLFEYTENAAPHAGLSVISLVGVLLSLLSSLKWNVGIKHTINLPVLGSVRASKVFSCSVVLKGTGSAARGPLDIKTWKVNYFVKHIFTMRHSFIQLCFRNAGKSQNVFRVSK